MVTGGAGPFGWKKSVSANLFSSFLSYPPICDILRSVPILS